MQVDITISALLAILTIAMAYLGVHVTLHPAESPRVARFYKGGFGICAACAIGLVVWQGVRNAKSQQRLATDLSSARNDASDAKREASSAKSETTGLRKDLAAANIRREQAERDLGIAVQRTEVRLSKQMAQTETVLSANINTYRTDTSNAVSRLVRPGRSFSPSQRASLVEQLKSYGRRDVAITPARGNQECIDFANAIEAVFLEAQWNVVRTKANAFIIRDGIDIQLAVRGMADSDLTADQMAVAKAFKSIGMQMEGMVRPEIKGGPVEIYVGLQR